MKGDYSRLTFDPKKHYSGVRMQQGRVQMDSDYNEFIDIMEHRVGTEIQDFIGQSGAPEDNPGFEITVRDGKLFIGSGRCYVNGLLLENENAVEFTKQPDVIGAAYPKQAGKYLAYLDVWQRHMTALEAPDIRDAAMGNLDTAARMKNVWQAKLIKVDNKDYSKPENQNKKWNPGMGWAPHDEDPANGQRPISTGKLRAKVDGSREGLGNQLYRLEIHDAGIRGAATYKWSRENGSLAAEVVKKLDAYKFKVRYLGYGTEYGFEPGDWMEISNDKTDLDGTPGLMAKIDVVQDNIVTVIKPSDNNDRKSWKSLLTSEPKKLHTKVRRWDSEVLTTGEGWQSLENNIKIEIKDQDEAGGNAYYKTGDYWLIPARNLMKGIYWEKDDKGKPVAQPPHGIRHYYMCLGVVDLTPIPYECKKTADALNCGHIDLENKSFSVGFWAKQSQTGIINMAISQGPASLNQNLHIGFRKNNKFTFAFYTNDLDTTAPCNDIKWHHWLCIYDSTNKKREIYQDGVNAGQDTAKAHYQGTGNLSIGCRILNNKNQIFNGRVENVCIWNRVLSASEIKNIKDKISNLANKEAKREHFVFENGLLGSWITSGKQSVDLRTTFRTMVKGLVNKSGDTMTGDLTLEQDLEVQGAVRGNLTINGDLTVKGTRKVKQDAVTEGEQEFKDKVTFHKELCGAGGATIKTASPLEVQKNVSVKENARFNGDVGMGTAPGGVKLHIKSASGVPLKITSAKDQNAISLFNSNNQETFRILDTDTDVQLKAGEARKVLIPSGNMGIGAKNPEAKLSVNGGVHVGGDSDPGDNNLLVDGDGTINGKVGIGTTPTSGSPKLVVNGDIKTNVALISDNPHGADYAAFSHKNQGTKGGYALLQHKDGHTCLNAPANTSVRFRINNQNKMTLDKDGNIGIGKADPKGARLHIGAGDDSIRIGAVNYKGTAKDTTTYGLVRSCNQILFSTYRDTQQDKIGAKIAGINKQTYNNSNLRHLVQSTDLAFYTVSPDEFAYDATKERLRITDTGKVGIGTSTPDAMLHVDGEIRGKMWCSREYTWRQGEHKVKMGPVDKCIAFLTYVRGRFEGGGESVGVYQENNFWYLGGTSGQKDVVAKARCFGIPW